MGAQVCEDGAFGMCVCGGPLPDGGGLDGAMDGAIEDGAIPREDGALNDGATPRDDGAMSDGAMSDGSTEPCTNGATRCSALGVERCEDGAWLGDATCALGCMAGACVSGPAMCTPDATRCYRSSVQRCNREGSAWLHDSICAEECDAGLCVGACTNGAARCVDDRREVCTGGAWTNDMTCALGCESRVCVEAELSLPGTVLDLSGTHVYEGCVDLDLGGELRVPAGQTLEIRARCLRVSASSRITIGAGSTLRVRVTETAEVDGTVSGGAEAFLESLGSLELAGSVTSARTILRADELSIASGGTTSGASLNAALYGQSFDNDGTHGGIVSVMPPVPLESSTHPSAGVWNLTGDDVVISWSRPFASARGYYVSLGDAVPGPGVGSFTTTESVVLPASSFGPGTNRLRVVAVNADSEIGTFTEDLLVRLNVRSPVVTSTSHPTDAWGGVDDVFLSWTDPPGAPAGTYVGFFYVWDRQADTEPSATRGTFDDRRMLLLNDQAPGTWYFHINAVDQLGRTSSTAHRRVRIGPNPGAGNVAGTVTDATTGDPIDGATVLANGGLLRTRTDATGDYTFRGELPASSEPYRITVRARGYVSAEMNATVGVGGAVVRHFELSRSATPPGPPVSFSWELPIDSVTPNEPSVAIGPAGRYVWSRVGDIAGEDRIEIGTLTGDSVQVTAGTDEYYDYPRTEVGWNGTRFHALDVYQCGYEASFAYGHGWSCLQMRTWDPSGATVDGWRRYRNSGQTGSPSVAWNGTSYGTFFISYNALYHRELTEDLEFADGGTGTTHDLLSSGHYDTRQQANTRAIWDGSNYAVAWQIGRSAASSTPVVFFARWSADLDVVQARMEIDVSRGTSELGLVFDGTRYHLLYVFLEGSTYGVALRSVSSTGVLGARTVIDPDVGSARSPSLAFDGRHLLLAYEDGSGTSRFEVRDTSHTLVDSRAIDGVRPRVDASAETGEGALIYTRGGVTYLRALSID